MMLVRKVMVVVIALVSYCRLRFYWPLRLRLLWICHRQSPPSVRPPPSLSTYTIRMGFASSQRLSSRTARNIVFGKSRNLRARRTAHGTLRPVPAPRRNFRTARRKLILEATSNGLLGKTARWEREVTVVTRPPSVSVDSDQHYLYLGMADMATFNVSGTLRKRACVSAIKHFARGPCRAASLASFRCSHSRGICRPTQSRWFTPPMGGK